MFERFAPPALARAAAAHPWRTVALWGGLLVISFGLIGTLMSSATTTKVGFVTSPESATAQHRITHTIGVKAADTEMVVVTSPSGSVATPGARAAVAGLVRKLDALAPEVVAHVASPFAAGLVSKDGRSALIPVTM